MTVEVERVVAARRWGCGHLSRSTTRALSCALVALGHDVRPWETPWEASPPAQKLSPIVSEFVEHRLRHRGIARSTIPHDVVCATSFLRFVRDKDRRISRLRIVDADAFILGCGTTKWAPKTVAGVCSSLRAFLRFLHASGRLRFELASSVIVPRVPAHDRPPRALPWRDVRRILRAIDVSRAPGRRDFAEA
jgi:site-specific recombinase XerD